MAVGVTITDSGMFYGCYGKYSVLILNRRFAGHVFSFTSFLIVLRLRRTFHKCFFFIVVPAHSRMVFPSVAKYLCLTLLTLFAQNSIH